MMQSTASPFPCKEEPQIKEEIIDVESTDNCFTDSSVDVDGGEVVTGNTLHNQRTASISTTHAASHLRARAVFSRHNSANTLPFTPFTPFTPVTPVTPAAHVTPVTPVTPAVHFTPVTPAVPVTPTTVPNNTGFHGNDVNTTEGLKFTAHPEKELPKSKPVVADVNATPQHDDILEIYFRKRPYISLAEAKKIYKKHGIPRNVTEAWFQVKRATRRGAISASGRIVICTKGQRVTFAIG